MTPRHQAPSPDRWGRLRAFLGDRDLSPGTAAAVLRGAFLSLFAAQGAAALLVAGVLAAASGARPRPTPWLGAVVVGASFIQVLVGVAVTAVAVRAAGTAARRLAREHGGDTADADAAAFAARLRGARTAALAASLMAAVLLSTPSWFAAFAWLSGNRGPALLGALALLALGYLLGFLQLGRLARGVRVAHGRGEGRGVGTGSGSG